MTLLEQLDKEGMKDVLQYANDYCPHDYFRNDCAKRPAQCPMNHTGSNYSCVACWLREYKNVKEKYNA